MFSLKVFILLSLIIHFCENKELLIQDNNKELSLCIRSIITLWFQKGSEVTYVDIKSFDNEIIKAVHEMKYLSLVSRTTNKKVVYQNGGYLITAKNLRVFKDNFMFLSMEESWNPDVYFLIIFKELELSEINDIFKILLHYHVFRVLVINGASNMDVYTYNPFENYGCGKVFTGTLSYGKCLEANITKSFFYKPVTGLKKCTLKVAFTEAYPHVIVSNNDHRKVKLIGLEQYILQTLSELEQFNIIYTCQFDPDESSFVGDDMIASGPMGAIQKGDADLLISGSMLKGIRAKTFSYLYGYHTNYDGLIILVKKAGFVSNLKNTYIEFDAVVWILLVIAFILFFVVLVVIFHIKDKCGTILVMWDVLFQHGATMGNKLKYRYFMFIWIVFAYLISIHYQSNLSGLTTHPSYEYQISKENDLAIFDIKPCLSSVIRIHFKVALGFELEGGNREECETLWQSLKTVSQVHDKYTITYYGYYAQYKTNFTDEYGKPTLYAFKQVINKYIVGIHFYKGFPMLKQLRLRLLHIIESGLFDKHLRDLSNEEAKKQYLPETHFRARLIIPWHIFAFGLSLATGCFAIEIIMDFIRQKMRHNIFTFFN